ncbi:hypothetical protein QA601_15695 [Chitinispirillales bacterium ANBcel5]|uniref:hypothetical protein n=1 Tax=Cellulosispirillum alkaliphilum TaxID=3039283 RepID=UPI002A506EA8|nr:hypothetical protein [Chitinispirillales bacterium ANBcel5]
MTKRIFCSILLMLQLLPAQSIGVLSEAQQEKSDQTIVEFVVDTNSVDSDMSIDLRHLHIHGTTFTSSAHITFYSNQKVAKLPAVLTLPNGRYSFSADNTQLSTSFVVDARGGYQQWSVDPGDHTKINNVLRYGYLPSAITFATGGIIAFVAGMSGINSDLDAVQDRLDRNRGSYTLSEIREAEDEIKEKERKQRRRRAWMTSGFSAMGVSLVATIPLGIYSRRHRMNAEMIESREFVPSELLHHQGESQ